MKPGQEPQCCLQAKRGQYYGDAAWKAIVRAEYAVPKAAESGVL